MFAPGVPELSLNIRQANRAEGCQGDGAHTISIRAACLVGGRGAERLA